MSCNVSEEVGVGLGLGACCGAVFGVVAFAFTLNVAAPFITLAASIGVGGVLGKALEYCCPEPAGGEQARTASPTVPLSIT